MSYQYMHSKILEQYPEHNQNHSLNSNQIDQIKSLEEEIQLTIHNYEQLLQIEKKNSSDRSEFLLYLIQSTRIRHQEELDQLKLQLDNAVAEKEEAQSLQKQMESIGEGVDSIVEEGKRLKLQNQSLQRELQDQQARQKQLQQEIQANQHELQSYRQKIDEWQRTKLKWNRRRKEMMQMISEVEKKVTIGKFQPMHDQEEHDQDNQMNMLFNKYKNIGKAH